jgi:hypothetical protein
MRRASPMWLVGCGMAVQLFTSGCKSGGTGFVGFFGGDLGGQEILDRVSSSTTPGGSGVGDGSLGGGAPRASSSGPPAGGFGSEPDAEPNLASAHSIASVHTPEPASLALFGGGLAGVAYLRRRKKAGRRV